MHKEILVGSLNERGHLEVSGVGGMIIFKRICKKDECLDWFNLALEGDQ
jgi:hypothetical protein